MANAVKSVPDGYHSVTPYLMIKGAKDALAFYARAFGAELVYKLDMPGDRIGHAEIQIGNSRVMLADEMPESADATARSPASLSGTTVGLYIYIDDVERRFQQAVDAGAIVKRPITTQFYGDRSGTVQDPFGHVWTLATHVEDVDPDEMRRRMATLPSS